MMALIIHLRRLQIPHISSLFVSQLLNPTHFALPSSSGARSLPRNLYKAFHQTLINTYNTSLRSFRFSTLTNCWIQNRYETFDFSKCVKQTHEDAELGVEELIELTRKAANLDSGDEALDFLDQASVRPNVDLIFSAVLALREEWKLAYLVFKWGEKWDCVDERCRCVMIWMLGNHRKFGTAWSLIHDLHRSSKDTKQAILTIIDRYVAANSVDKAMRTFKVMEKVCFSPDQEAFFTFLNILCKHGNIEEAEEFMFLNKKFFPLETEGFNIILNGWCNVAVDIFEAKRIWREMSKCCILPNGTSYRHLIACFSKIGNLFDSLRLYDEMKKRGLIPGIEVYNSLAYVLASQNCLKESLAVIDKMKEAGWTPDSTTYNNIIRPLCEAGKVEEARSVVAIMTKDNVSPTIDTYHTLLTGVSFEETLEVLQHMRKAGIGPDKSTFLHILAKFFELKQPENALEVWLKMPQYEIVPDVAHYTLSVEGLVKCGLLVRARELYAEMTSKGFPNDPKLEKMLKEPVSVADLGDHTSEAKHNEKDNLSKEPVSSRDLEGDHIAKHNEKDDLSSQGKSKRTLLRNKGHRKSSNNVKRGHSNPLFTFTSKR
ncbi:OLC1v1014551C2 [Oldenlandia corymbosa var. corymbosa]|uniref:OLC1v1014551C2 n=1 Tax=Oldenlandia corymbosa var. corymbosa TaxID=529605 RepID=A0AAV1E1A4_OLDCO|nr:OLC1v1014551C2 [Oldenlandia corymbosa var. corymbosa]